MTKRVPTKATSTSVNTFWATQIKWFLFFSLARECLQQGRDTQIPFHFYALCHKIWKQKHKKACACDTKGWKMPRCQHMSNYLNESAQTRRNVISPNISTSKQQSPHSSIFSAFPVCINNPIMHRTDVAGTGLGETELASITTKTSFFLCRKYYQDIVVSNKYIIWQNAQIFFILIKVLVLGWKLQIWRWTHDIFNAYDSTLIASRLKNFIDSRFSCLLSLTSP